MLRAYVPVTSQVMPDHTALDCKAERYSRPLTSFLKTTAERACAYSCVGKIKHTSIRAAIDNPLQSSVNWGVHWYQTMAGRLPFVSIKKKPVWSNFYVSPVRLTLVMAVSEATHRR